MELKLKQKYEKLQNTNKDKLNAIHTPVMHGDNRPILKKRPMKDA